MNLIKPKKLNLGDTISIIAPAGGVDLNKIEIAKKYFTDMGYKIKLGSNINKKNRYLAGTDEEKIDDLQNAFLDEDVKAIICARGGYGAIRLINKIDYDIIKNNPKIFCGYSDITALSIMILKQANLITYSGPMIQSDFANAQINAYTEKEFFNTLQDKTREIKPINGLKTYSSGSSEGILFGGNLATVASLCGQDFIPNEDFIFFTEDINEDAYKIDKYFTQLLNINKFKNNLKAIILGDFTGIDNHNYLEELITELSNKLDIPIYSGYPISHTEVKATIPIGAKAYLNEGTLTIAN